MQESEPLRIGFAVNDISIIPAPLQAIVREVVECYRFHHRDLRAVYLIGSIAIGEWQPGVSDMDIVGITDVQPDIRSENGRRQELASMDQRHSLITFVDNAVLSLRILNDVPDQLTTGRARLIAISGVHVWGEAVDLRSYLPSVGVMARERVARAELLMRKYRAGDLIEPFLRDERLLIRSCAKAAMRVLSSIAILRGGLFYTSPRQTYLTVERLVPEGHELAQRTLVIIDGACSTVREAMSLVDQAVELFRRLYPESPS